jgi:hypothetical protein
MATRGRWPGRSGPDVPAVDFDFAVDSALELQRAFEPRGSVGGRVFVAFGVGHVYEAVVLDHRVVALVGAEQRPRMSPAFDDIVPDGDGLEIAGGIEPEKPFGARSDGGAGNNMVVADLQIVEHFVDPHDPAARIADQTSSSFSNGNSIEKLTWMVL